MAITAEKVEFLRINSDIQQDDDDAHEKDEAPNEDEEEIQQQSKDPQEEHGDNGQNKGKENNGNEDNGNGDNGNGSTQYKPYMEEQLDAMEKYVPFVAILGWRTFVQEIGVIWEECDPKIILSQWFYLFFCVLISFMYYMREQHLINHNLAYNQGKDKKIKVHKWRYVISHVIVTIIYLLTLNEQPILCLLARDEQSESYLRYTQLAVVSMTTATIKGFKEFATDDGTDPLDEYKFDYHKYLEYLKGIAENKQKACICCLVCIIIILVITIIVMASNMVRKR